MKKEAILDLILLLIGFWTSWYFKAYFPLTVQGPFVVVSTSIIAIIIIKIRHIDFRSIGFVKRKIDRRFFRVVFTIVLLIFALQFIGIFIIGFMFGSPSDSTAITQQPKSVIGFILDNIFIVWIVTALGEEFIFRGIIINRLEELFKTKSFGIKLYVIALIQSIWFGLGHQSQGLSGILITGLIGFGLGIYLLKNKKSGLWPLIVAHGLVNTIVLTVNFIS